MAYKRKRIMNKKSRYRIDKFKFARFIIILLIIIGLAAFGIYKAISGNNDISGNASPSPSPDIPSITATAAPDSETAPSASPSGSPDASQSPAPSVSPDADSTAAPAQSADLLETVKVNDGIKTAYLTFDDGPTTSVTPLVLDALRKYNVKATFFVLGKLISANPDVARRVYEEGHQIANHTYAHEYSELYATEQSFMDEVTKTQTLIDSVTGKSDGMKLVRFPGGGYNAGSYGAKKQTYKKALANAGYVYCDWNALSKDSEGKKNKTAQELFECAKETIGTQEDVVILMHDANGKKATAQALPMLIEYLKSEGYELRTLDGRK